MNSSAEKIESAVYAKGHIIVHFSSGLQIHFPVAANPRLSGGSDAALSRIEVSPYGLHWPDLDEDLSFAGLLRGDFGQRNQTSLTRR